MQRLRGAATTRIVRIRYSSLRRVAFRLGMPTWDERRLRRHSDRLLDPRFHHRGAEANGASGQRRQTLTEAFSSFLPRVCLFDKTPATAGQGRAWKQNPGLTTRATRPASQPARACPAGWTVQRATCLSARRPCGGFTSHRGWRPRSAIGRWRGRANGEGSPLGPAPTRGAGLDKTKAPPAQPTRGLCLAARPMAALGTPDGGALRHGAPAALCAPGATCEGQRSRGPRASCRRLEGSLAPPPSVVGTTRHDAMAV